MVSFNFKYFMSVSVLCVTETSEFEKEVMVIVNSVPIHNQYWCFITYTHKSIRIISVLYCSFYNDSYIMYKNDNPI